MTWSWVDDFHVVRRLDVGGRDHAFAVLAQAQRDFIAVVQLEHHALEVQQMLTTSSCTPSIDEYSCTTPAIVTSVGAWPDHRRQQHAAQRVAQRVAVATLERLQRDLGAVAAKRLDVDGFGFQQIGSAFRLPSIPSARYTDKADEQNPVLVAAVPGKTER
jgi:hypothetical protein